MRDRVVLITGSSRGIGKAIAYRFASLGDRIILNANSNQEQLMQTYRDFKQNGFKVDLVKADVSKYREVSNMTDYIYGKYGNIDVLINNAGISYIGLITDMNEDEWQNVMDTNLNSVFNCCKAVIPRMVNLKSGCIINISSIWGICGASCEVAYSASKGAVNSFTKALAKEVGPSNIRVNAIACGVIDTDMNNWLNEAERQSLKDEISLMRFGNPSEIANLAEFLSSDKSSFITGQIITADGGMI